jgi:glycogen(starch) synthase
VKQSNPERVLMTADTIGGVWTYTLQLCRALGEHGVSVTLATMGAPLRWAQAAQVGKLRNVEVHESNYKLEWMENPWQEVDEAGAWLLELAERCHPDVVHLNGYVHGALPWDAPVLMVAHSCVLSWWRAVYSEEPPAKYADYHRKVGEGIRHAARLIAPSRAMLDMAHHNYGPLPPNEVIVNGCDVFPFPRFTKDRIIFAAGRVWDAGKNLKQLAEISHKLAWPVYIAGEGQHPEQRFSNIPHPGGACGLGNLSSHEMAEWLSRAGIFVSPARYEPFGLSILEAALAGCALVLGDIASLREIWGDAALFVSPSDQIALEFSLEKLISDSSLRCEMSHRARRRAATFTPAKMAIRYLSAYQQLMSDAKKRPSEKILCAS